MSEAAIRSSIVAWGRSLFARGLSAGSSGNISVRIDDGFIVTPTNSCLGFLIEDRLSRLNAAGKHLDGDPPSKELPLHFAFYFSRPSAGAVVHLHSSYATALSCLTGVNTHDAIPPLTPYAVMRLGKVPLVPYARPGSAELRPLIEQLAADHPAVLLRNHGPVVSGKTLEAAIFAIEELEEAAKLIFLTRGRDIHLLDDAAIADLNQHFQLR